MPDKVRRYAAPPSHPDLEVLQDETVFARHLEVDVVRFRHRLFAGGGAMCGSSTSSAAVPRSRSCCTIRNATASFLVEQFRIAAHYARSPWQLEAVAGLIDAEGETPE